jgi:hypothetical protein
VDEMKTKAEELLKQNGLKWMKKNREGGILECGNFENTLTQAVHFAKKMDGDVRESLFEAFCSDSGKIVVEDAKLFAKKMGMKEVDAELMKQFNYNVGLTHQSQVDRLLETGFYSPGVKSVASELLLFRFEQQCCSRTLSLELSRISREKTYNFNTLMEGCELKTLFAPEAMLKELYELVYKRLADLMEELNNSKQGTQLKKKIIDSILEQSGIETKIN